MCDTLVMMIESLGFVGKSFMDGIEIIRQLESDFLDQVACIFADTESIHCTDGYELLRMLEHANLAVPVVAMCDESDENRQEHIVNYGFTGCIVKPLTAASMAKALKACTFQHSAST
jgi:FixJ family two-component response regulator